LATFNIPPIRINLKNIPAKFHSDQIWNGRALGFFEEVAATARRRRTAAAATAAR